MRDKHSTCAMSKGFTSEPCPFQRGNDIQYLCTTVHIKCKFKPIVLHSMHGFCWTERQQETNAPIWPHKSITELWRYTHRREEMINRSVMCKFLFNSKNTLEIAILENNVSRTWGLCNRESSKSVRRGRLVKGTQWTQRNQLEGGCHHVSLPPVPFGCVPPIWGYWGTQPPPAGHEAFCFSSSLARYTIWLALYQVLSRSSHTAAAAAGPFTWCSKRGKSNGHLPANNVPIPLQASLSTAWEETWPCTRTLMQLNPLIFNKFCHVTKIVIFSLKFQAQKQTS